MNRKQRFRMAPGAIALALMTALLVPGVAQAAPCNVTLTGAATVVKSGTNIDFTGANVASCSHDADEIAVTGAGNSLTVELSGGHFKQAPDAKGRLRDMTFQLSNVGDLVVNGTGGHDRVSVGGDGVNLNTSGLVELQFATGLPTSITLNGGAGNDQLRADGHRAGGPYHLPVTLNGQAGHDLLIGGDGDDTINGGPGRDRIDGGGGSNTLNGDGGNDRFLRGSEPNGVTPPAYAPLSSIGWHSAWWADGPEFTALGLAPNAAVPNWPDEIGTKDLTQATTANQPLYRASVAALNDRRAIEFDGVNDFLRTLAFPAISQPNTVVCVCKLNLSTGAQLAMLDGIVSTSRHALGIFGANGPFQTFSGASLFAGAADTSPHLFIFRPDGLSGRLLQDGTVFTGDTSTHTLTGLTVGARFDSSGHAPMSAAFVGIVDGTITPGQEDDLLAWFDTYYTGVADDVASDTIDGGAGNNTIDYSQRTNDVTVDLAAGVGGEAGETGTFTNIQNATGGKGDDTLLGDHRANVLRGGPGDDTIDGRTGNDKIYGGAGHDNLSGGGGNDLVYGGPGHDQLFGNAGNDRLFGGPGNDHLDGGPGNDFGNGGKGNDTCVNLARSKHCS